MKKTLVFISLLAVSTSIFSLSADEKEAQEQENMKMLADMGLPLPGSGIKIVPRSSMNLSKEQLEMGAKEEEEIKSNGYVKKYINRPQELLNFQQIAKNSLMKESGTTGEADTGLKRAVSDVKLAFDFEGFGSSHLLKSNGMKLIAAAPQGGFHEDKGGWSGVVQFFSYENIGTCSYGVMNVKASNTAAQLAQEDVTYIVNSKPTLLNVEGSENSGFLYSVKWYDLDNFHDLECANLKYSKQLNNAVIDLANKIDSKS